MLKYLTSLRIEKCGIQIPSGEISCFKYKLYSFILQVRTFPLRNLQEQFSRLCGDQSMTDSDSLACFFYPGFYCIYSGITVMLKNEGAVRCFPHGVSQYDGTFL